MVKLRLRRKGSKHNPFYDIVAVDESYKRDGKFLDKLGYYNPITIPATFVVDHEKAIKWLNNGAQPTRVVKNILSYDGVLLHRSLLFKDKTEEEIGEALNKHKEIVATRYKRRKELRRKRELAKKAAAKKAESEK
ncbi:MAG TPA: 30S ribosomal protein S16 [Candidatus Kapabacteria bacterium]|jgi:small subunit ribosomal protein S16|nr:30S ribosomal protein S16 [Candidatus Kapabacteria bacterium]HOV92208.1 30S ribosomal protein S16 [Candidatus Kapabacteria bacterium]